MLNLFLKKKKKQKQKYILNIIHINIITQVRLNGIHAKKNKTRRVLILFSAGCMQKHTLYLVVESSIDLDSMYCIIQIIIKIVKIVEIKMLLYRVNESFECNKYAISGLHPDGINTDAYTVSGCNKSRADGGRSEGC